MQNLKIMNNSFITTWSLLSTLKASKQAIPDCWTGILWAQPNTLDNFRNVERMNDSGLLLRHGKTGQTCLTCNPFDLQPV